MDTLVYKNSTDMIISAVQELSLAKDLETLMHIVPIIARKLIDSDGSIFVWRDGDFCYYAEEDATSPLMKGHRFPLSKCISGLAIINHEVIEISDIYEDDRILHEIYKYTFIKSLAIVPIGNDKPIGAIENYWNHEHEPTEEEMHLLRSLVSITVIAIKNLQVHSELENRLKESAAELQVVNKELESFGYSASHDLRAPLRAINGYLNVLSEDYNEELSEEAKRLIASVVSSAQSMNILIDGLLRFSKTGKRELVKTKISMEEIVSEICKEQTEKNKDQTIELIINNLPDTNADETLVKQVWINYISNAIKFTGHKTISQIEIGSEERSDTIIYYVKDNGAGFNMQYHFKLFNAFQRLHSQEEFKGAGVGLAIVQRIILKHGGLVWADSKVNEGATFYFSLPKK